MASSVSSERAFSSAGITISKRRNRLKGDIVEALQALKCMIHKDLLFREEPLPAMELVDLDVEENGEGGIVTDSDGEQNEDGWDALVVAESDLE